MSFEEDDLESGLKIIGEVNPSSRSCAIGFFVRTGSRDENPGESGLSHFLEHMVFKGSETRDSTKVNKELDLIGASSNAFTSEENTVYYGSVLPEYLPRMIDLFGDILRPALREADFAMEKKVILEEIEMYEDQPGWKIFETAKSHFFGTHPLSHSVLGTKESVSALKTTGMHEYFDRRYVAGNVTVAVAGNFEWNKVRSQLMRVCDAWPEGVARRNDIRQTTGTGEFLVEPKADVKQEYVVFVTPGPPAAHHLRYAATLLAMVLGDAGNSRLHWGLVDTADAESADCSYQEYDGTGAYYVSLVCTPEKSEANIAKVQKILAELQAKGITDDELNQARNKALARLVRASEKPSTRMMAIGSDWTYLKHYRSLDEEIRNYEKVNQHSLKQLIDRYSCLHPTVVALGPQKKIVNPFGLTKVREKAKI